MLFNPLSEDQDEAVKEELLTLGQIERPTTEMCLKVVQQLNQFKFEAEKLNRMHQFECQVLDTKEFQQLLSQQCYQVSYDRVSVGIYEGFTFVSPEDLEQVGNLYVVACLDGQLVGVLKVKRYEEKTHRYVSEAEFLTPTYYQTGRLKPPIKTYLGVRYIDVHQDFRQQGLSWVLFARFNAFLERQEQLSPHLKVKQPVLLSFLTEEGKRANLLTLSRKALPSQRVSMAK